jgi:cell division control protein 6
MGMSNTDPDNKDDTLANFKKFLPQSGGIFKPGGREYFSEKYMPSKLHHRDEEIRQICNVLAPSLNGDAPNTLMIYGESGVGKTAVITYVGNNLEVVGKENNKQVKFVYINCSMVDTSYALFQTLGNKFSGNDRAKTIPSTGWSYQMVLDQAKKNIDESAQVIILALDEIDRLVKKSGDDPLHTLLTMQRECSSAKVGFVGISNDLRLTEELDARVRSRLCGETITFNRYTADQLKTILLDRAKEAFNPGTYREEEISLCAAIAGKENGDARRALSILRTAAELAERKKAKMIEEEYIYAAKNTLEKDIIKEAITRLKIHEKLVLYAICILENNNEAKTTGAVYSKYSNLVRYAGMEPLSPRRVTEYLTNLDDQGLVSAPVQSSGKHGRTKQVSLNIPLNETVHILEEDKDISEVKKKMKITFYKSKRIDELG